MPHSNHKSEEQPLDPYVKTKYGKAKLLSFSSSESSPSNQNIFSFDLPKVFVKLCLILRV